MFRNATMFSLPAGYTMPTPMELSAAIGSAQLREPGPLEPAKVGFVPPIDGHPIQFNHQGAPLFAVGFAERILPASVVDDALAERLKLFEARNGRKPGKMAKSSIREDVLGELLPRSHIKRTVVRAYLDHEARLLVCDTSSRKRAEAVVRLLRDSLGTLPAKAIRCEQHFGVVVRDWLRGQFPATIGWGPYVALRAETERATFSGFDAARQEIEEALASGLDPTCIALIGSAMTFRLHDDMRLTSIKWEAMAIEEDATERDADEAAHVIAVGELRALVADLRGWFGWVS